MGESKSGVSQGEVCEYDIARVTNCAMAVDS
jgi:hypothetical protein